MYNTFVGMFVFGTIITILNTLPKSFKLFKRSLIIHVIPKSNNGKMHVLNFFIFNGLIVRHVL